MIIYEVTLDIEAAIADEYRSWLHEHVEHMLALPGFTGAQTFEVVDPAQPGRVVLCTHYRMHDAAALDAYLREHSARMRADGINRFGERFRSQRRVLHPL